MIDANELATQEQVERVWRSEWKGMHGDKLVGVDDYGDDVYKHYHYSICKACGNGNAIQFDFCPRCGRAMTPEAMEIVRKRLPANKKSSKN